MKGRDTMFLRSDASSSADTVRQDAGEFADSESRALFYKIVIEVLTAMMEEENADGPEDL